MQQRRGFTLIELLVVVSIIAMLIGILLPSLKDAQEQARVTVCASNQRTLIQTAIMYSGEFDGRLPLNGSDPYMASGGTLYPSAPYWDERMRAYLGKSKNTTPFTCPTVRLYWHRRADDMTVRTYRMNVIIAGYNLKDTTKNGPELPVASYKSQDRLLVFGEDWTCQGFNVVWGWNIRYWADVTVPHRWAIDGFTNTPWGPRPAKGGGNFAFADGHVAYYNYVDGDTNFTSHRVENLVINPDVDL